MGKKIFAAFLCSSLLLGALFLFRQQTQSISKESSRDRKKNQLQLRDAASGKHLTNTKATLFYDFSVRCIKAPCPTGKSDKVVLNSDNDGFITVPPEFLNPQTLVSLPGYSAGINLKVNWEKISENSWALELDADERTNNFERRLKLIDKQTNLPLGEKTFYILDNLDCMPPECTDFVFKKQTNYLGNVYISAKYLETNVNYWIFLPGYNLPLLPMSRNTIKIVLTKSN
jgi:hypothetical protein